MTPSLLKEARGPQRNDSRDGQGKYKMSLEHFVMPESNEIFQKKVCVTKTQERASTGQTCESIINR